MTGGGFFDWFRRITHGPASVPASVPASRSFINKTNEKYERELLLDI